MFRFLLGLVVGLAAGYKGTEYWLQRREEDNREQEESDRDRPDSPPHFLHLGDD